MYKNLTEKERNMLFCNRDIEVMNKISEMMVEIQSFIGNESDVMDFMKKMNVTYEEVNVLRKDMEALSTKSIG